MNVNAQDLTQDANHSQHSDKTMIKSYQSDRKESKGLMITSVPLYLVDMVDMGMRVADAPGSLVFVDDCYWK